MDLDIEEMRDELKEQRKLLEDTNHVVHQMRRSARWSMVLTIAWWLTVAGVSGAAYYYFVWPYVEQVQKAYGGAQNFQSQVEDWFHQFTGGNATSTR